MRWFLAAAVGAMAIGTIALAQRERLPSECRREIVQLCRGAEGGFGQCLRTALPKLSDPCRKAVGELASARSPVPAGTREFAFGTDPMQRLDLVKPEGSAGAPVLLFIHGGGWSIGDKRHAAAPKAQHFTSEGWAFGSVNYRLVPQARVEDQAADVASAVAWIRANAAREGLDPDRIVLMGHSAGAHLAALVGTDPRYFAAAGVPLDAVKGIVLLDGAGYDVPKQMAVRHNPVQPMYEAAFSNDAGRQKSLSPTLHAASPNVAHWLILPVASRPDARAQSNGLAAGLKAAGADAIVVLVPNSTHMTLNRELGSEDDFATGQVTSFLARIGG